MIEIFLEINLSLEIMSAFFSCKETILNALATSARF